MITIKNTANCSGCGSCSSICPHGCLTMQSEGEGFLYPHVDADKCADCGLCVETCPINIPASVGSRAPQAFAAWNRNAEIRENSSSGGLFTLLAEKILKDGGVVFGAAFAEDYHSVHHIKVETSEELYRLRGSKYLQSIIGNSYIEAQKCLDDGKPVLFTGTPCQIGGLKSFLGKDYPLLYTQDIICHGVPSPKIWAKYVDYREQEAASKTRRTFFRHKKYGWKRFSVQFEFTNCTEYIQILSKDLYMRGFLADLYLRPSCHHCSFKGISRLADITLADFWGVSRLEPDMDDDKGTSLVLIHSEKGYRLFDELKEQLRYKVVDLESAIAANSAATKSAKPHPKREHFFLCIDKEPLLKLISDCLYESPLLRAKKLIVRIFRKIKCTFKNRSKL